jgi:hypothetical protein
LLEEMVVPAAERLEAAILLLVVLVHLVKATTAVALRETMEVDREVVVLEQ